MKNNDKVSCGSTIELLRCRQAYSLNGKLHLTKQRIKEWYEYHDGNVCVSFSGGKDSTVLLHIVRSMYPDVEAVFCDTGLEYPEIREFVKIIDNVTWLKPAKNFKRVIEEYGYPVVSKQVSYMISTIRNPTGKNDALINRYLNKINSAGEMVKKIVLAEKWKFLINAPFKISDKCCDNFKKKPLKKYQKKTGKKPFIGTMAYESQMRARGYINNGCNAYDSKDQKSTPLAFWLEEDVWEYIEKNNLSYSKIYNMGYERTGCMFCMFGCHVEKEGRFLKMEKTHPKQHNYCINKLGLGKVLDYIGVEHTSKQMDLFDEKT